MNNKKTLFFITSLKTLDENKLKLSSEKYELFLLNQLLKHFDVVIICFNSELSSDRLKIINIHPTKRTIYGNLYSEISSKYSSAINGSKILFFGYHPFLVKELLKIKRRKQCRIVSIIYDYHYAAIKNKPIIKKTLLDILFKKSLKRIRKIDGVIFFNKHANEVFHFNIPYIVSSPLIPNDREIKESFIYEKSCIFAGTLSELNCIDEFVDSINYLKNKEIIYHIFGDGIKPEKIANNKNIVFHGLVNQSELQKYLLNCGCLVCLRKSDSIVDKVSFPSKFVDFLQYVKPMVVNSEFINEYEITENKTLFVSKTISPKDIALSIDESIETRIDKNFLNQRQKMLSNYLCEGKINEIILFLSK